MVYAFLSIMQSSCKLADFGLARSLSQSYPTFDSNGNEEACLTDYVGNANRFVCNRYYDFVVLLSKLIMHTTSTVIRLKSNRLNRKCHLKCHGLLTFDDDKLLYFFPFFFSFIKLRDGIEHPKY